MLTLDKLHDKILRRYPELLLAWLIHEDLFPLRFPVGKSSSVRSEIRAHDDALEAGSKRYGYRIDWAERRLKTAGKRNVPVAVYIDTPEIMLAVLDKQAEFLDFQADSTLIRTTLPALDGWLLQHPEWIIEFHNQWPNLLEVCQYFVAHPQPDMFARELPISQHTKFIEQNKRILRTLFDHLLADTLNHDQSEFTARYGLRADESFVRLRLLDHQLERRFGLAITDLSVPISQLDRLDLSTDTGLIIENKTTFLTLPPFSDLFAVFGSGFDVSILKNVTWLRQCRLLYWGDLDIQGFEILAMVCRFAPHTESIMMDRATFDAFAVSAVTGTPSIPGVYGELTPDERVLSQWLADHNLRLEQEHIPVRYSSAYLMQTLAHSTPS